MSKFLMYIIIVSGEMLGLKRTYDVARCENGCYLVEYVAGEPGDCLQLNTGTPENPCRLDQEEIDTAISSDVMKRALVTNDWKSCHALIDALKTLLPPEQQSAVTMRLVMVRRKIAVHPEKDLLLRDLCGQGELWTGYRAYDEYKESNPGFVPIQDIKKAFETMSRKEAYSVVRSGPGEQEKMCPSACDAAI